MKLLSLLLVLVAIHLNSWAQTVYSGNVIDAWDKNYLEGVEVTVIGKGKVVTNSRGYFSIPAIVGDTLFLSFPGFVDKKLALGEDRFFLLELQDRARLLPTFQVKSEPYRFRFKDGRLTLIENEVPEEKPLSSQITGGMDKFSSNPNFSIYGPISYFTRRNRQVRAYEDNLKWLKRREGYLEIIDSESVRTELMARFGLDRKTWDELVIRFNQFHQTHSFLDWSQERVREALTEFLRIEMVLGD